MQCKMRLMFFYFQKSFLKKRICNICETKMFNIFYFSNVCQKKMFNVFFLFLSFFRNKIKLCNRKMRLMFFFLKSFKKNENIRCKMRLVIF